MMKLLQRWRFHLCNAQFGLREELPVFLIAHVDDEEVFLCSGDGSVYELVFVFAFACVRRGDDQDGGVDFPAFEGMGGAELDGVAIRCEIIFVRFPNLLQLSISLFSEVFLIKFFIILLFFKHSRRRFIAVFSAKFLIDEPQSFKVLRDDANVVRGFIS